MQFVGHTLDIISEEDAISCEAQSRASKHHDDVCNMLTLVIRRAKSRAVLAHSSSCLASTLPPVCYEISDID